MANKSAQMGKLPSKQFLRASLSYIMRMLEELLEYSENKKTETEAKEPRKASAKGDKPSRDGILFRKFN